MPRRLRIALLVILCALSGPLAGCQPVIKPPPVPAVVHDVITRYVAIPAQYTAPIKIPERASNRVQDVVDAYNRRGEALATCNRRLSTIDALGGQAVPAAASSAPRPP